MIKNILKRVSVGAMAAVIYSDLIAIIISFCIGDGNFHPVSAGFANLCSTQAGAVLMQFITMIIFGAILGGASLIFKIEKWSLLKRTVIHFVILTSTFIVVALFAGWISLSVGGILGPFGGFFGTYAIIWFAIYFKTRHEVSEMNDILKK